MQDYLVLRLDSPLIAFGGPMIDNLGVIRDFPARSMLCGLIGNALGYTHAEGKQLQRLQRRLLFAVRRDREGREIIDYQTVFLGQDSLTDTGWTTWGVRESRQGGAAATGTHIRYRHYRADAVYTVALTLDPPEESPGIEDVARALRRPARPLFIGRKCCIPSAPILVGHVSADNARTALERVPQIGNGRSDVSPLRAWWPAGAGGGREREHVIPITDERDWENQIHAGRRFIVEGTIQPEEVHHG